MNLSTSTVTWNDKEIINVDSWVQIRDLGGTMSKRDGIIYLKYLCAVKFGNRKPTLSYWVFAWRWEDFLRWLRFCFGRVNQTRVERTAGNAANEKEATGWIGEWGDWKCLRGRKINKRQKRAKIIKIKRSNEIITNQQK